MNVFLTLLISLVSANIAWGQTQYQNCPQAIIPRPIQQSCLPAQEMQRQLNTGYNENLEVQGVIGNGSHAIEFYSTPEDAETPTWTLVLKSANDAHGGTLNSVSCMLAAGEYAMYPDRGVASTKAVERATEPFPADQISFLSLAQTATEGRPTLNQVFALVNLNPEGAERWALMLSINNQSPCIVTALHSVETSFSPASMPAGTSL